MPFLSKQAVDSRALGWIASNLKVAINDLRTKI